MFSPDKIYTVTIDGYKMDTGKFRKSDDEASVFVVKASMPDPEAQGIKLPNKPKDDTISAMTWPAFNIGPCICAFMADAETTVASCRCKVAIGGNNGGLKWNREPGLREMLVELMLAAKPEIAKLLFENYQCAVTLRIYDPQKELALDGDDEDQDDE